MICSITSLPLQRWRSNLKPLAEAVVQLAVRVLFIVTAILMTAAAFPVRFHPILLPVVAVYSSVLAIHFYLRF